METNPQYGAAKAGIIGLVRGCGNKFLQESITVNCFCPGFVPTGLAPPGLVDLWPKEHITPMSTVLKVYDTFMGDDQMTGQAVEISLDQLYFRPPPEHVNDSQRWIANESKEFWEKAYAAKHDGKDVQGASATNGTNGA